MSYATNSFFLGEINGESINTLNRKIDYTKVKLEDRKKVVEEILDTGFYHEYIENYYKVSLNSNDFLSEDDAGCSSLERLANYLLNSEESKEANKDDDTVYKFYSDEKSFQKAISREPNIDGMGDGNENVIHFLKNENRNYKKSKIQKINKKDLERDDWLGDILRQYDEYLKNITTELNNHEGSNLSRFKLSEISGSVKRDMIDSKNILLGVFGAKTNAVESTVIDWSMADFTNYNHVRALLYVKPGYRFDEDLMFLIDDFVELLKESKPTKLQKDIIELLHLGLGPTAIGEELCISKQRVNKNIEMITKRVCRIAKDRS